MKKFREARWYKVKKKKDFIIDCETYMSDKKSVSDNLPDSVTQVVR